MANIAQAPFKALGFLQPVVLAALLTAGSGATSASAQIFGGIFAERFYAPAPGFYGYRHRRGLDAAAVVDLVRADGFRNLTPPVYRGDVYLVEATDPRGRRVRLFVDSIQGEIRGGQILGREQVSREPVPRRRETARVTPIPRDPPIFRSPEEGPASAAPPSAPRVVIPAPEPKRLEPRPPVAARPLPDANAPLTITPPAAQPQTAAPPRAPRTIAPPDTAMPKPVQPRPPVAARPVPEARPPVVSPPSAVQPRTPVTPDSAATARPAPRRIELSPPAILDDAPSQRRPIQPGINAVPPAALE